MRTTILALGLSCLLPALAHADLALRWCNNTEPVLAEAMLRADVIAVARVEAVDEKDEPTARGWHYSWSARVKIEQVWHGRHPLGIARFEGSCSGTMRSSKNHCSRPPGTRGSRLVLFLARDQGGKLYLSQPRFSSFGECPDASAVARARKQNPALFARILGRIPNAR